MNCSVDHIGIAVDDLDAALRFYTEVLGLRAEAVEMRPELGLRLVRVHADGIALELIEARDWKRTTRRHLEHDTPGAYHIGLRTADVAAALVALAAAGVALIDKTPRRGTGMVAGYCAASAAGGVLVELVTHLDG